MERPTVFLFCYRFFDIRHLVSAGVIRALSQRAHIVLLAPDKITGLLQRQIGDLTTVESMQLGRDSFDEAGTDSFNLRHRMRAYLALLFGFVYGNADRKPNMSADLHRRSYIALARQNGRFAYYRAATVISLARLASHSQRVRRVLQAVYEWCAANNAHAALYDKYKPSLSLVCSFGLSVDGMILAEAKQRGVPTCTIVQSWDKTSSKGYPVVHPHACILWSDVTADEAHLFLDMPRERIFVEGAPLWDGYFRRDGVVDRDAFFSRYGFDPGKKLIFVSLGATNYHEGNLTLISDLVEAQIKNRFAAPVQLLFRQHPSYLMYAPQYAEFKEFIERYAGAPDLVFTKPSAMRQDDAFSLVEEDDFATLASTFTHCDLSISVISSHLIEAAIFDKPSIGVEYGRWTSELYDFDLSGYTAEHLYRLYRVGSMYRAGSWQMLLSQVNEALANPAGKAGERKQLVDQEAPVNRGCAAARIADRLVTLAGEWICR